MPNVAVEAVSTTTDSTVLVTSGAGGAGQSLAISTATMAVRLKLPFSAPGIEFKVDSGAWQAITAGEQQELSVNLATQTIKLRRLDGGSLDIPLAVSIDTLPTTLKARGGTLAAAASGVALTDANAWTKPQSSAITSPAYAATITLARDSVSNHINVGALTGNLTLANPTGFTDAVALNVWLTQDGTGSRLLTLGNKFKTGANGAGITLSTAAGAVDLLSLVYNPTKDIWLAAIAKGIS